MAAMTDAPALQENPAVRRATADAVRPGGLTLTDHALVVADLFARDQDGAGELNRLPTSSCLRGAVPREEVLDRLAAGGFRLRRWEDHSGALARLAVQLLWEDGSTARLWCPGTPVDPAALRDAIRRARPGYFLLVAETRGG